MTLSDIQIIVVIAGSLVALVVAWRKSGPDLRKAYAEAADLYQQMAAEQAKKNQELTECQQKIEKEVQKLKNQVGTLTSEAESKESYIQELTGYVEQLIEIMSKAGLIVPERPRRKQAAIGLRRSQNEVE